MVCYVCDGIDFREVPKEVNDQKRKMLICKNCGNLFYEIEPAEENKIKEFYRKDYRQAPTVVNLITTTHKLNYIKLFLADYLKDKKDLVCGDVGCATGYLLNFLQRLGHKVTGSELTINFRRFCEHFYNIPIAEELPEKHKYDFIAMYHTLEHFIEPDKKLLHYKSLLKDDGVMFISTPMWFDCMEEHGGNEWKSFEHYFHINHINIFTQISLQMLFRKCGLVIVKEDYIQYGQTYLLRKQTEQDIVKDLVTNKWEDIEARINVVKQADQAYQKQDYKKALELYPKFPDAYSQLIFNTYRKEPDRQKDLFAEAFDKSGLNENTKMKLSYALWLYQADNFEEAFKELLWLANNKPTEEVFMYLGWCSSQLGHSKEAMNFYYKSQELNPQKWNEAMNWVCREACQMPTWDEVAIQQMKEKLLIESKFKPELPNAETKN